MKNNSYTEIYPNLGNENKEFKTLNTFYTHIFIFSIINERLEIMYNFAIFLNVSNANITYVGLQRRATCISLLLF